MPVSRRFSLAYTSIVFLVGVILWFTQKPAPSSDALPSATTSTVASVVPAASTSSQPVIRWPETLTTNARITRTVDGDTVDALFDGETKVARIRLLGINTPESVDPRRPVQCFGKEASRVLKELVEGDRVHLVEDPQADDRDRYGRLLRHLVTEEGIDVNATLVAQGYAHAYLDFPLGKDRKAQLRRLESEAREAERGLWSPKTCDGQAVK